MPGRRILLTGDLAPPGLDDVMAELPVHCDVLLVPHHGSRTSEPAELATWSTPRWAVISNGRQIDLRPVRRFTRPPEAERCIRPKPAR